jgi:hypothetical protein
MLKVCLVADIRKGHPGSQSQHQTSPQWLSPQPSFVFWGKKNFIFHSPFLPTIAVWHWNGIPCLLKSSDGDGQYFGIWPDRWRDMVGWTSYGEWEDTDLILLIRTNFPQYLNMVSSWYLRLWLESDSFIYSLTQEFRSSIKMWKNHWSVKEKVINARCILEPHHAHPNSQLL